MFSCNQWDSFYFYPHAIRLERYIKSFSRNVRNELKKSRKIYFYDNGIRNAILSNFSDIELRPDKGALWENFLVSERIKFLNNHQIYANRYFWRTPQQQEIDYIEEKDGQISAYEFKWNTNSKKKIPKTFVKAYPESTTNLLILIIILIF